MMTHEEEYLEIHSKYVIKELYDMLTDNKDLYINDNIVLNKYLFLYKELNELEISSLWHFVDFDL